MITLFRICKYKHRTIQFEFTNCYGSERNVEKLAIYVSHLHNFHFYLHTLIIHTSNDNESFTFYVDFFSITAKTFTGIDCIYTSNTASVL